MTMIRFEGLTELGEALEALGANPAGGLTVGATYNVTDIIETTGLCNVYHYTDDDGDSRSTFLKGNLFTFTIININH